ncbi:A24 family peptidase [Rhodococcus sp. IEGM 1409]|uniref:prepilin peptidase n=1 Tax=Rhodococcus sp. IEGM 1409 TaxID=3047082 RepID=UPI0024B83069|nr:A24 family peptidase [Rhodococcus sp. IEGM 1409]MDI9900884.1 A24 family peptidase [Rhodococcus sp. IEGM 1409]
MLETMWTFVVLAGAGAVAGAGARAIADSWLRRHGYRPVATRCCVPQWAVATGWVVVGALNTSVVQLISSLAVVWWCVAISAVDLAVRRLPNSFTLPGYAVVMVYATVSGTVWAAVVGSVLLAGIHLLTHLMSPGSMGLGDVKLSLSLGALTGLVGADAWLWSLVSASVLTAALGIVLELRRLERRKSGPVAHNSPVAHGPSMCLAACGSIAFAWWT